MKLIKVIAYNINGICNIVDDHNKLMETIYALDLLQINYEVYWIKEVKHSKKDV